MKNTISILLVFLSLNAAAAVGRTSAVESFLASEFQSISSISSFLDLAPTQQCDEVISVYVTGNLGSGTTSYDCTVCLVEDGGIYTADSSLSECYRD